MRRPGEWDGAKLDLLLETLKRRVSRGCASANAREREDAEVLGYWYYQLKDCHVAKQTGKPKRPRRIERDVAAKGAA